MSEATTLSPEALIEALLFASPQPLSLGELSRALGLSADELTPHITALESQLATRGLRVTRHGDRLQLVTAPEAAPYIEAMLGLDVTLRLSRAALETLSIIAYAQPITRPQIEAIRGVSSDSPLRTLLTAGLIEELGRAEALGRPILYGTTFEFLQLFGLRSVEDLPPLTEGGGDAPPSQTPVES